MNFDEEFIDRFKWLRLLIVTNNLIEYLSIYILTKKCYARRVSGLFVGPLIRSTSLPQKPV